LLLRLSGDTVPLMFLLMLGDLHAVDTYSWDNGTLAWLYRSLCRGFHSRVSQIGSNLLLLQVNKLEKKVLKLYKLKILFQYLLFFNSYWRGAISYWTPISR
ncbi:PMD domain-containing protein, partial [Cephalotus follicularis]